MQAHRLLVRGAVLDPFWLIVAVLAIATVLLWPIRAWMASRRNRDDADETPLAPPERRHRG